MSDLRGRLAAAVSMLPNLDALERVVEDETRLIRDTLTRRTVSHGLLTARLDRVRAELDKRDPQTMVSVRTIREWLNQEDGS